MPARGKDVARNDPPQRKPGGKQLPGRGRGDAPQAYAAQGDAFGRTAGKGAVRHGQTASRRPADATSGVPQHPQKPAGKGAPAKNLYPQADFARREGMLEGMPAVMLVNRSLKDYSFRKEFPWCLRLVVAYRADSASGLPLPKEERVLEAFEQNLFGLLKKSVNGHYVGHTSWGGSREFVFYMDDGGEAEDPLNAFAANQKRELELAIEDDPQWTNAAHYFDYRD